MSKTRKLLSVVIALMMVVSMFALTANAAYYYETDENAAQYTQTWGLSEPVKNSDGTYTVNVSLKTNYPTGAIQFVLKNTASTVASIKSVTLGSAIPTSYNATISANKKTGKIAIWSETSSGSAMTATAIDGVIATVVYTYSGSGSATISIENSPKSASNVAGTLMAARMDNANLVTGNPYTGQTVSSVGNSVTIGSAAKPTLAVIDGKDGVIDTTRTSQYCDGDGFATDEDVYTGYIYGVEPENSETVEDVFEVINGGTMEIVANDAGSQAGTGTIVNVKDSSGTVVETYVLVIFGDVDGDGEVGANDSLDIDYHDVYMYAKNDAEEGRINLAYIAFAADVNLDGSADANDSLDIDYHDVYMFAGSDDGRMYQADIIAKLAQ